MNHFFIDASGLAKRYAIEAGGELLDRLFDLPSRDRLMCLLLGVAEVVSVLTRKRNRGELPRHLLAEIVARLWSEIADDPQFRAYEFEASQVSEAVPPSVLHNINSTDAVLLLRVALDLAADLRTREDDLVLVASDQRLLRAAQAEELATFDPETDSEADLDALIGA